jgi:hypothetical protein
MGVLEYSDAVILSVQIGWRKPHPAIFTATQITHSGGRCSLPARLMAPAVVLVREQLGGFECSEPGLLSRTEGSAAVMAGRTTGIYSHREVLPRLLHGRPPPEWHDLPRPGSDSGRAAWAGAVTALLATADGQAFHRKPAALTMADGSRQPAQGRGTTTSVTTARIRTFRKCRKFP